MARELGDGQFVAVIFGVLAALSAILELICYVTRRRKRTRGILNREEGVDTLLGWSTTQRSSTWSRVQLQHCISLLFNDLLLNNVGESRFISCPWYIKPRTIQWFFLYIDFAPNDDPQRFREFFRLNPDMFSQVCNIVRDDLTSAAPATFHSLPNRHLLVERQVAVALRRLATGDQLLGIAELFGLSKSTAVRVTWKFISSFSRRARGFVRWPRGGQMEDIKESFWLRWGFPNCCGAIDVTHILIELPLGENPTAYYDWRHNFSITMQAVVDLRCLFLDVKIGCPGSIQDSRVLRMSSLYHDVIYHRSKLNGPVYILRDGNPLHEYLLGDKGYPTYRWLITPYTRNVSIATDRWNQQHSGARMCVERAFGKLKGTWRILSRQILRPQVNRLASTVMACVLLHNMAILRGEDNVPANWAEFPAHPPGYEDRPGWNRQLFDGGNAARDALFDEVEQFYS